MAKAQAARLHRALQATKISAPATDCLSPIGEARLSAGLAKEVAAAHYVAVSRPPRVYRGNPFVVEVAMAFGRPGAPSFSLSSDGRIEKTHAEHGSDELMPKPDEPARLLRFANRVPLLFEQGSCVMTKAVAHTNFRAYGLEQPKGALPVAPLVILLHVASVWVPFTSESKEAVAAYPEIERELGLALRHAGRKLATHLRANTRLQEEYTRRAEIAAVLPHIGAALSEILGLDAESRRATEARLGELLTKKRSLA